MEILTYIIENLEEMAAGAVMVLTGLAIIARLTPNPQDDKWVAKFLEFFRLWPKKKE